MPFDLILPGGRVVDPSQKLDAVTDFAFAGGKVAADGQELKADPETEVRDVSGLIVSPGIIDLHTHVYWGGTSLGIDAEEFCRNSGVTTSVDTGSAGPGKLFAGKGALLTVANATLGLMLAFAHSRRSGGRYAVMPSFTFAATAQAALWCGLTPEFIDIDPDTWCPDINILQNTIRILGSEVALIVSYATFGTAIDLFPYAALHNEGIPVVIDAAASVGTTTNDLHFGVDFPGLTVFSLHATKAFPIGEGGIIYGGKSSDIAQLRQAANFGFTGARESAQLGLNAKLSELHAAVGLATLDEFPDKKALRREIYVWYEEYFEKFKLLEKGWRFQKINGSAAHQFVPTLCPENMSNLDIIDALNRLKVSGKSITKHP